MKRIIPAHYVSGGQPVEVNTTESRVPYPVGVVTADGLLSLSRAGAFELVHALLDMLEATR